MATWTFLGVSASNATLIGNKAAVPPAITYQQGDLLVAIGTYRDSPSFTAPAGWEMIDQNSLGNIDSAVSTAIASGFVAYCVAGSGGSLPASHTFTRTGGDVCRIVTVAYRSSESGNPTLGQHSMTTAATNGTSSSTSGFTTSGADALLIGAHHGARSVGCSGFSAATDPTTASGVTDTTTAPSSTWCERYDAGSANGAGLRHGIFDAVKATAGATGTFTLSSNGDARNVLSAIEFNHPSAAVSYTLTANSGSFSLTGTQATVLRGRRIAADPGSFVETGTQATLQRIRRIAANSGSFAWTVTSADIRRGWRIAANAGNFAETGTQAQALRGFRIGASSGSFAWTGSAANLQRTRQIVALAGSFSETGTQASLVRGYRVAANSGSFSWTGFAAGLTGGFAKTLSALPGTFAITGTQASLRQGHHLVASPGSFVWSGQQASVKRGYGVGAQPGSFSLSSGPAARVLAGKRIAAQSGSIAWTGFAAGLSSGLAKTLSALPGAFSIAGSSANLRWGHRLSANTVSYSVVGTTAQASRGRTVKANAGALVLSGTQAGVRRGYRVAAQPGSLAWVGFSAGITAGSVKILNALPGSFSLAAPTASLRRAARLNGTPAAFSITASAAGFRRIYQIQVTGRTFLLGGLVASLVRTRKIIGLEGAFALTTQPAILTYEFFFAPVIPDVTMLVGRVDRPTSLTGRII